MAAYLARRLVQSLLVLWLSSAAVFALLYMAPGGPLAEIVEQKRKSQYPVKPEDIERLQRQYDLDLPLWQGYTRWLAGWPELADRPERRGVLRGDFGVSWRISQNEPTFAVLMRALPNTLRLMLAATLLALAVAVPVGIYSATHQYSPADYAVTAGSFFGVAMPVFWLGSMLLLLFSFRFREWGLVYLPAGGVASLRPYTEPLLGRVQPGSALDQALHMVLPTITLSLLSTAQWSRFTRSAMLEVLRQDYVRTARAKGVREHAVVSSHALRNALIPLITVVSLQIPGLFGGAVITETVFSWQGMGRLFIESLVQSDWPVALAYLLIQAVLFVLANLLADILYGVADPRIRYS
jgi:peptide/nickel transport system permease protein